MGRRGREKPNVKKHDFTSFSFMALVNACIFSNEQEGRMATGGVKEREKGNEQLYALPGCLSVLRQQR